jgi:hypothetical protein
VTAFYQGALLAFMFWGAFCLGSIGLLLLHNLVGGPWGVPIRPVLEASRRTLPVMALLFLPVLGGLNALYHWPEEKAAYLNSTFFIVRAIGYFALWFVLPRLPGGLGLVLFGLSVSFATIDWAMSLEPHWYSTIYGLWILVDLGLQSLALAIVGSRAASEETSQDLGSLLLMFVMLWAYMAFSQMLIIWSGNLPEEISWYVRRSRGGWEFFAAALALGHFAIPFFLLLSRQVKRKRRTLRLVAAFLLVMSFAGWYWLLVPAFETGFHWAYLLLPMAAGIVWIAALRWNLRRVPAYA